MKLLSLNLGRARAVDYTDQPEGVTGIDKRPVDGPVRVTAPGPKGIGGSGLMRRRGVSSAASRR